MLASLAVFALAALAPAFATPTARQIEYHLLNDGTKGTITNQAEDFGPATFHTSAFMSRGGCSSTAAIKSCYAADLSADPTKMLATADYKPYVTGGIGTNQRALLLSRPYTNATGVVTHTVRFHISTGYTAVPQVGLDKAVTFVGLRNFNPSVGVKALDIRARTFTGEQTSGTWLYVAEIDQDGAEAFPSGFSLADALGKTIEVTYKLGANGATVDKDGIFVGEVSAKFVNGGQKLFTYTLTKTLYPNGVVDASRHELLFGADRKASAGQKQLKYVSSSSLPCVCR